MLNLRFIYFANNLEKNMLEYKGIINIERDRIISLEGSENLIVKIDGNEIDFGKNAYAYPGFTDSHGHIAGYGMRKMEVNFSETESIDECVDLLAKSNICRGDWLVGYGWNQEAWADKSMPNKAILDAAFPDNPVFMLRVDGHSALANSVALKIAEIDSFSHNPSGGIIAKDHSGNPTGLLIDNAIQLVSKLIPNYSFEQNIEFIKFALNDLAKYGITEVHDMDVDTDLLPIYQDLEFQKKLPIRVCSYVKAQNNEWLRDSVIAYSGNRFSIKGLKYYIDGALGSRGAALLRHYEDDSSTDGVLLIDEKTLLNRAKRGILSGFDIAMHAIGDRAVRFALDSIEHLRKDAILKGKGKFRIEHSQIIHQEDISRYKKLDVTASVQPIHYASDACGMAQKRLGAKMRNAYLWKTLLSNDIAMIAGSDFPIESPSVIEGIRAFVHRLPFNAESAIFPEEKISLDEAIDAYCVTPHKTTDTDAQKGAISTGKLADITILSDTLKTLEGNPKADFQVLATYVGGKEAYRKE